MTLDGSTKQSAALKLLRKGMITLSEAAELIGTSRQLVRHWTMREEIDAVATRAAYLRTIWRRALRHRGARSP